MQRSIHAIFGCMQTEEKIDKPTYREGAHGDIPQDSLLNCGCSQNICSILVWTQHTHRFTRHSPNTSPLMCLTHRTKTLCATQYFSHANSHDCAPQNIVSCSFFFSNHGFAACNSFHFHFFIPLQSTTMVLFLEVSTQTQVYMPSCVYQMPHVAWFICYASICLTA